MVKLSHFLMTTTFFMLFNLALEKNSTESCLSFLTDKISKGFDSGLYKGLILIDLQKAFDTIDK